MKKAQTIRMQTALFLAAVTLFWFAQYVYIPYQTIYLTAAGTAGSMIGTIVGAYGISQMLLRLPVGLSADKVGRHKPFILIGTLASGTASVIRMISGNASGFLLANLFSGLASAMWISFMVHFTAKEDAQERQKATARILLFNHLGILIGYAASTLLYSRIGMRNVCLLSVLAGAAAFGCALLLEENRMDRYSRPTIGQLLMICLDRKLIVFAGVALILQGIGAATTTSFTNQLLADLGASNGLLGISSIINMLSTVLFASVASSGYCSRKGPRFWIPVLLLVLTAYCGLVPLAGRIPLILALQILPGITSGILFSLTTAEAMTNVPAEKKSTAMGFFQAVYAIGMSVFPIFTGKLADTMGMRAGYFMLAGIALAGSILMYFYYRTERNR